jgi:hypothetical protein
MSDTFLAGKAADMAKSNPAEAPAKTISGRARVPMSLPRMKLQVPERPGFKRRWIRGETARLEQALDGGYTFVERGAAELTQHIPSAATLSDGNTDLGSRISIASGSGPRMYLMKIPEPFWEEDQQEVDKQHEAIAAQIRGDRGIQGEGDMSNRYAKPENRNIFKPRRT